MATLRQVREAGGIIDIVVKIKEMRERDKVEGN